MSLIGENTLIVSTGISCQTANQLHDQAELLSELLGDKLGQASLPLDWMIVPVTSASRIVQSGVFHPNSIDEIEMRKRPYWKSQNAFYWHHFKHPELGYSIPDAYEDTVSKFTHMGRKLRRWSNKKRIVVVGSNTQNNIEAMSQQSGIHIPRRVFASELNALKAAWETRLGRQCEMIFVAYREFFTMDADLDDIRLEFVSPDGSEWEGSHSEWAAALTRAFNDPTVHVAPVVNAPLAATDCPKTLSIVVPFHNSHAKSRRLMETMQSVRDPDVEFVFVDDGGTKEEALYLRRDAAKMQVETKLTRQKNAGPGGARNAGIKLATGQYVWFVDSDDDIDLEAISTIRALANEGFDFIDFDISRPGGEAQNSMAIEPGRHDLVAETRSALIDRFGRVCTKAFSQDFIRRAKFSYPEFCVYEDNALVVVLPFFVRSFFKSTLSGYTHHTDSNSVTRVRNFISLRYYDRLETAILGLDAARSLSPTPAEIAILLKKFRSTFLVSTINHIFDRGADLDRASRVVRHYRGVLERRKFPVRGLPAKGDTQERTDFYRKAEALAGNLPDQTTYFGELKRAAWGRAAAFPGQRQPLLTRVVKRLRRALPS
jgi:glycosyltransferase involved in cell wall biosynthesis